MKLATQRTDQLEDLKQLWRYQIETGPDPPHGLLLDHFFSSDCVQRVVDVQEILKISNRPGELDEASIALSVSRAIIADYLDRSELAWYLGKYNNPPRIIDSLGVMVPIAGHQQFIGDRTFETLIPDKKTQLTLYNFGWKRSVYIGALRSVIAGYVGKKTTEELTRTSGGRLEGFPAGVKWEEVAITFKTLDSVEIRARGFSKKFHYAELGFKDNRVTDRADKQWGVLRTMAIEGSLSWDGPGVLLKPSISIIRRRLKTLTGIDDDPFHPYKLVREYSPRFTLVVEESVRRNLETRNADTQESDIDQVYSEEIAPRR